MISLPAIFDHLWKH